MSAPGLIIAAPASGGGKTLVTLALLRRLRLDGIAVASCKTGPDYIDPAFHARASGRPCFNLDPWAMRPGTLAMLAGQAGLDAELMVVEGVMGLFDGAADGTGSTADLAVASGWPVVLVLDARGQGASAAAVARGFRDHRADVHVAGVILNQVGGPAHEAMLRHAVESIGMPVFGCLPRRGDLTLPGRHLGLVQAEEHADLETFLDNAAEWVGAHVELKALRGIAQPSDFVGASARASVPPLGSRIAVARDAAFAFSYPHVLEGWRAAGAEVVFFSPLADEAPDGAADAVYLPGGYPELHAGRLAANRCFREGLGEAANRGAWVFGECGGYMVLGRGLVDGEGEAHVMAGLLPLETSFQTRRLHLGYREGEITFANPLGSAGARLRGHEFHYATVTFESPEIPLFTVRDSAGTHLGAAGTHAGTVMGSFVHVVDQA